VDTDGRRVHAYWVANAGTTVARERVSWVVVGLCSISGGVLTALPFVAERLEWTWSGTLTSTLTNLGTTLLLAAAVFFLERGFLRRVSTAASEAATKANREFREEIRAESANLQTRLTDLETRIAERVAARDAEQDEVVAALADDVSFSTVTSALQETYDLDAFEGSYVEVPASRDIDGPRFAFSWELSSPDGHDASKMRPRLLLTAHIGRVPDGQAGRPIIEVEWRPEQSAADVGLAVAQELRRRGYGLEARQLDWQSALSNFATAISQALAARRADDGAWFNGQVLDWINENWAVTTTGLFHREHSQVLTPRDFPDRPRPYGFPLGPPVPATPPAPRPGWVPVDEWEAVYKRAAAHFPQFDMTVLAPSLATRRRPIDSELARALRQAGNLPAAEWDS
jgi:hypothetical protein